ncbi:MAG: filamentous hemagglutinin N-terminal domain-containing protein [Pseudanabaena sp. CRU_2_10]|nr:filamentous hemagglutinin N-terminal domain-containing protein [Pseudanabaena sp. CRU_2_10]
MRALSQTRQQLLKYCDFTGIAKQISWLVASASIAAFAQPATAQLIPDRTTGTQITPNLTIKGIPSDRIDLGTQKGNNLFHSFREFNIGGDRGVYFSNPTGVTDIFARVTGGNPSSIFGRLGVLGTANLFLLNPQGFLFGPNASLDLNGSLFVNLCRSHSICG